MFILKKEIAQKAINSKKIKSTSSNFWISLSVVGGGWLGAGTVVAAAGEATLGGAGTGVGCKEDSGGFSGEEPGLGGSEGWIGELPLATVGRGTGNADEGASAGAGGSGPLTDSGFVSFSCAGDVFAIIFCVAARFASSFRRISIL